MKVSSVMVAFEVDSVAALRNVTKIKNKIARTSGYYAAGDGGNGDYWLDASDTSSADNGFTVIVAADGGRWKLQGDAFGWYNAKQAGAKIDGSTDDTAAIQNAVNLANINIPAGIFKITSTIVITIANRHVRGAGRGVTQAYQYTKNQGGFWFKSPNAYTVSDYLNGGSISDMTVAYVGGFAPDPTVGTGILLTQMNGHRIYNVSVSQFLESVTYEGGQLNSLKSVNMSCNGGSYSGAGTALLHTRQSPIGGGASYQKCYTVRCEDTFISATLLRDACVRVHMADGLTLTNSYWGLGKNCILLVSPDVASDYIGGVTTSAVYMDCVSPANTVNGIEVRGGAFAATLQCVMQMGSGTFIANGSGTGIISNAPLADLVLTGVLISNFITGSAINVTGDGINTAVNISGCEFTNCGQTGVIGVSYFDALRNLAMTGTIFKDCRESSVNISGTFKTASFAGNTNSSNIPDIVNTASFPNTEAFKKGGNSSGYTGTADVSWVSERRAVVNLDFPNIAVGAAATLTATLNGIAVADTVVGNLSGATNLYNTGTGTLLFVYGISAANTVSVKAWNLGPGAADPVALDFNIRVQKK